MLLVEYSRHVLKFSWKSLHHFKFSIYFADAYRVSVIPNKYSEGLLLPGDVLAHVTSMTFGLYDLYEGTLIKEWDLRHTKRFSLQSKGPAKDVDRIAVIQFSKLVFYLKKIVIVLRIVLLPVFFLSGVLNMY